MVIQKKIQEVSLTLGIFYRTQAHRLAKSTHHQRRGCESMVNGYGRKQIDFKKNQNLQPGPAKEAEAKANRRKGGSLWL